MTDKMQRFIFTKTDVRGELARLDNSYQDAIATHHYPAPVAHLLGEFLTATALLSATIKFEGTLTLQASSQGQIPLIMAEATSTQKLRAIARNADNATSCDFKTLLENGQLTLSITPTTGTRYQGIVSLDGNNLAECLQEYFLQSEQLTTKLWLYSDAKRAAGLLLQELPAQYHGPQQQAQYWEHISHLTQTLSQEEILSLDFESILYRLYHQEQVRLFESTPLIYQCSCSRHRTLQALKALGQQEIELLLREQRNIKINCEFCHQYYQFNEQDIAGLFKPQIH